MGVTANTSEILNVGDSIAFSVNDVLTKIFEVRKILTKKKNYGAVAYDVLKKD